MKIQVLANEFYKNWCDTQYLTGGLKTFPNTTETNINFSEYDFIEIIIGSSWNYPLPNKVNSLPLKIYPTKYFINVVNGIDDFIKFVGYSNVGSYTTPAHWTLTKGGKLTQIGGSSSAQATNPYVDIYIRYYKEIEVGETNPIINNTVQVVTETSQLANMYAENVQVQKDVLKELKNQTVNLEVQGRFLAQSTRMWATEAVLGTDEYQNAKFQVMEENL